MPVRTGQAEWKGALKGGSGTVRTESGAVEAHYSASKRFEDEPGTNPEELIGAAHAGCFSMALAHALAGQGHDPQRIRTTARVHLDRQDDGFRVTRIVLQTEATVPGIDDDSFQEIAEGAKQNCPVSKLLTGAEISLEASLS